MKPKHDNGKVDTRYTVTLEHTGQPRAMYVARFLRDHIGSAPQPAEAWAHCIDHQRDRLEIHDLAARVFA